MSIPIWQPRVMRIELEHSGRRTELRVTVVRSSSWTSDEPASPADLPEDFREALRAWLQGGGNQ